MRLNLRHASTSGGAWRQQLVLAAGGHARMCIQFFRSIDRALICGVRTVRPSITVRLNIVASLAAFFLVSGGALSGAESNWPQWRGPQENGHTSETGFPKQFTPADVDWKLKLPGIGQSSPILWGDRIFLTSSLERGKERIVF